MRVKRNEGGAKGESGGERKAISIWFLDQGFEVVIVEYHSGRD